MLAAALATMLRLQVADGAAIQVDGAVGQVSVEAGARGEVVVESSAGPGWKIEAAPSAGGARVTVRCAARRCDHLGAALALRVPADAALSVVGARASVAVRGVRGPVDVDVAAGEVSIERAPSRGKLAVVVAAVLRALRALVEA